MRGSQQTPQSLNSCVIAKLCNKNSGKPKFYFNSVGIKWQNFRLSGYLYTWKCPWPDFMSYKLSSIWNWRDNFFKKIYNGFFLEIYKMW